MLISSTIDQKIFGGILIRRATEKRTGLMGTRYAVEREAGPTVTPIETVTRVGVTAVEVVVAADAQAKAAAPPAPAMTELK